MSRFLRLNAVAAIAAMLGGMLLPSTASAGSSQGKIVFDSDRGGHVDLWVMNPDGSGQQQLTDDKIEDIFPSWSPDGSQIVWTRGGRSPTSEIWVMNADGSGATQLTFDQFPNIRPTFSPDGSKIVFHSLEAAIPRWSPEGNRIMFSDSFCALTESDIFTVNPDGTGVTQVTDTPENEIGGAWSPFGDPGGRRPQPARSRQARSRSPAQG